VGYELLQGLYLGATTNADLTSEAQRQKLHVRTPLDALVARLVMTRDVVITGNPGDGKSHLVRHLQDRGRLGDAEVILDLSASDDESVLRRWHDAALAGRRLVLCANEGPLTQLLARMAAWPTLSDHGSELMAQLGRLVAPSPEELPAEPERVYLIDLADRELVSAAVVTDALQRVTKPDFVPAADWAENSIVHVANETLFGDASQRRFTRVLAMAARRANLHVSFRQLWATISFAMCGGETEAQLERLSFAFGDGTDQYPLDRLTSGLGQGALIDAVHQHADPSRAPWPTLDEDIWWEGTPSTGKWEGEAPMFTAPSSLWASGQQDQALRTFASIKRLVALQHTLGDELLDLLDGDAGDAPGQSDDALLNELMLGLRRLYISEVEEAAAPTWLREGVPVWSSLTYGSDAASARPHVATNAIHRDELRVLRPARPAWLGDGLGPPPAFTWLRHVPSGASLRVDAELARSLRHAARVQGPFEPPEPVERFLARVAGWLERQPAEGDARVAFLSAPRGALTVAAIRATPDGARYEDPDVDE